MDTTDDIQMRVLDERYIEQHQEILFDAWEKIWKDTEWEEEEPSTLNDSIKYIRHVAKNGTVLVAEKDGQIISCIMFVIGVFPKPLNHHEVKIHQDIRARFSLPAYLYEFATVPEYRGKGIGGMLLDTMEQQLRKSGVDVILLWTGKTCRSLNLYGRNGFKRFGESTVLKSNNVSLEQRVFLIKKLNEVVSL